jgi:hypothetical protein
LYDDDIFCVIGIPITECCGRVGNCERWQGSCYQKPWFCERVQEFRNEVALAQKLRLLGSCIHEDEKVLIYYEFFINKTWTLSVLVYSHFCSHTAKQFMPNTEMYSWRPALLHKKNLEDGTRKSLLDWPNPVQNN